MVRASRSKRSENSVFKTFIATSRSSRVSRAFHTSPMPPSPIAETISYGPSFAPGFSSIREWQAASIYYTETPLVHRRCPLFRHCPDDKKAIVCPTRLERVQSREHGRLTPTRFVPHPRQIADAEHDLRDPDNGRSCDHRPPFPKKTAAMRLSVSTGAAHYKTGISDHAPTCDATLATVPQSKSASHPANATLVYAG